MTCTFARHIFFRGLSLPSCHRNHRNLFCIFFLSQGSVLVTMLSRNDLDKARESLRVLWLSKTHKNVTFSFLFEHFVLFYSPGKASLFLHSSQIKTITWCERDFQGDISNGITGQNLFHIGGELPFLHVWATCSCFAGTQDRHPASKTAVCRQCIVGNKTPN